MSTDRWLNFESLRKMNLKTARAWAIKDQFLWFGQCRYTKSASKFFEKWYSWAIRSRLTPIIDAATTLKKHFENILT
jgi:transposase